MSENKFPIVGIGASAGGIEALEQLFSPIRDQALEMAFVVVMHLDPSSTSMLPSLLARWTSMKVAVIEQGQRIEPRHVYVIPPDAIATIKGGILHLRKMRVQRERTPIDLLFQSLAEDQGENAVGIILSGAGSDGSIGMKAVKEHGGFTIAQGSDGTEPRFREMPQNALATGLVDLELPIEDIAKWLSQLPHLPVPAVEEKNGDELKPIFVLLRERLGHDFSQYKTKTFTRRVRRRMQVLQIATIAAYITRLQTDPEEPPRLFRDLLIGVTEFFRNPEAFEALEKFVIPKLFENKSANDEVRIWVAGCATGEEAYSIGILLREYMDSTFRHATPPKVTIFASDIDNEALKTARAGNFSPSVLKQVSPERLRRFFSFENGEYRVRRELRDLCLFTSHNLIRDPPFSRLDLISCRNLLIYMKTELQKQIFPIFHYALRSRGFLFLGASESILRYSELFLPVDKAQRVFQRRDLLTPVTAPLPGFGQPIGPTIRPHAQPEKGGPSAMRVAANMVSERYSPAYVIVNERWEILHSSARTGKYLEAPVGPPSRDLMAWTRNELRFDLRDALRKAIETQHTVTREHILIPINGGFQGVKIVVEPVREANETVFAVVFVDVGPVRPRSAEKEEIRTRPEGEAGVQQLEAELQETRERLQATIEELETANEELKSSNEELLSVNEELQSTNEEMETSKEEIQSVNEELQTVNQALNHKVEELDRSNADLQNLFESTQVAVIFLDEKLVVRSFTPSVQEIFNLISGDAGRPLTDIVNRLDDSSLLERLMHECLQKKQVVERRLSARGRTFHYLARIVPYRTVAGGMVDGVVVVFVNITDIVAAEEYHRALGRKLTELFKNTMETVSSLATQTATQTASIDTFMEVFFSRLGSISFTHELLSTGGWTSVPMLELINAELATSSSKGKRIALDGPQVWLMPNAALTLGVVFHELGLDAARYGAWSVVDGEVRVEWNMDAANRNLEIAWSEKGGPQRGADPNRTFGFELIQRTVAVELQGKAEMTFSEQGLRCIIVVSANHENLAAPPVTASAPQAS